MEKFLFVTERIEKAGNIIRVDGTLWGELPATDTDVEILSHGNKTVPAKVSEANLSNGEKSSKKAHIILTDTTGEIETYDVISALSDKPQELQDTSKGKVVMDNRRLRALLLKYKENVNEEILGAIFENIAIYGKFYLVSQVKRNGKNSGVIYPTLQTPNKHQYYPAFTTGEELAKSPKLPGSQAVICDFDLLVALLHETPMVSGIVIDPFSSNFLLDRKILAHIRDKKAELKQRMQQ